MPEPHSLQIPSPLRMDNAFAYQTMAERVPAIIQDTQAANPDYPASIQQALDRLRDALLENEPIAMLDVLPAPPSDYSLWEAAYRAQRAKSEPLTWQHSEWFFAETFCYRHLIQAVRWFETRRDPFAPKKNAELHNDRLWRLLDAALHLDGDFREKLPHLLLSELWGNRVDLSHPAGDLVDEPTADDLLVDDRDRLMDYLTASGAAPGRAGVHLVIDNAGVELSQDLALADALLAGAAEPVVMHLKAHPTYVSDATIDDVWQMLAAMDAQGGAFAALAGRLRAAWEAGRLVLAAHPFWTSSGFLREMPPDLFEAFGHARLVITKGDVNYRRAVGDALWDPSTPFGDVMAFFPAPLLALRSIKSDPLVGVPAGVVAPLDEHSDGWRVTGRYGMIEFSGLAD